MKKSFLLLTIAGMALLSNCNRPSKPFSQVEEGVILDSAQKGEEKILSTSATYFANKITIVHGKNDPAVKKGMKFQTNTICPTNHDGYTSSDWCLQ